VGWEKVACWSTIAAISLKRVKTEEKLPWRAYRNSPTIFLTVPSPTTYSLLLPKMIGRSQPLPDLQSLLFQEQLRTSNMAGTFYNRVHRNKSPLKFRRKGSVGVFRDCANFSSGQGWVTLRTSNCVRIFRGSIGTNGH